MQSLLGVVLEIQCPLWPNWGQITHFHKLFNLALRTLVFPLKVTQLEPLLALFSEMILTDLL